MRRKMWFNLGMTLMLVLALGSLALMTHRAQAGASTSLSTSAAALGSGFTYQGRLTDSGGPVNDSCDFKFTLYDAATGGSPMGSTVTTSGVSVTEGLFTVSLDFGSSAFTGEARWLKAQVRCPGGSGSYTALSPRQALTAAPYALSLQPGADIQGNMSGSVLTVDNTATSGSAYGVFGSSTSTSGRGLSGYAFANTGFATGVYGISNSTDGRGVIGVVNTTNGATYGVYGHSYSIAGRGVYGYASTASGTTYGVYGRSNSTSGTGVYGYASATSGTTYGVYGWSNSTTGTGVYGYASATSGNTYGVYGESNSTNGQGVHGIATATSGYAYGVKGESWSTTGRGVYGIANTTSGTNYGLYGVTNSSAGYAGYFSGNVHVTGDFTVTGAKSFKIDHPLDPQNKYLYHYNVESSEVVNQYTGNAVLDENGTAWVVLPAWFQALNQDFRYQLTPIGGWAPLYIAYEIQENRFQIAGGEPGMKVSWEVTALRDDPYLRDHPAQTEQDKPASEQGTYLYPLGYGQPESMGLDYQINRGLDAGDMNDGQ